MMQMMNWLCLISVSFLVLEILVFFCKDAIKVCESTKTIKAKSIEKSKTRVESYVYSEKIAR